MPFFTLNFYTKVLILATLLAVGVWNQKNTTVKVQHFNDRLANKQVKPQKTTNVLVATLNKL